MSNVIVVGAGPTGLVLAHELALAGVPVTVVERQAAPSGQSRGGGLNPRTAELLAMRGLLDAVTARAVPRESVGAHFAGLPVPLDARPWRTRYPDGLLVPQDRLEEILESRLGELGVVVRRRTELTAVTPDGSEVEATVDGPSGVRRMRAGHLVGCDGAHSTVRRLIGATFPGRAGTMSAVSADIELAAASATVPSTTGHISALTRRGGGYWMLLHPLDADGGRTGGYRAVFGGPEQATIERAAPVTEDEVTRALTAVHGPDTVLRRLRWGTRFSDASRQLTDYRHGPVLFAGDAAHIHPPIGGQGLNLGVQDAMNLGWKLAATLRGRAAEGLLDSYHAERHPVAERVLPSTRAQGVLMSPPPEADDVRALREIVIELARLPDTNRYLAGLMSGLDIRYDLGDPHPLVGARMLDLALRVADRDITVSALLRTGRGLLLELGDAPAGREADRAMAGAVGSGAVGSGVQRVVARVVDSPVGTELGVDRVLVRPDGYVCWVGTGADPVPAAVLHRWFGAGATTDLVPASAPIAG